MRARIPLILALVTALSRLRGSSGHPCSRRGRGGRLAGNRQRLGREPDRATPPAGRAVPRLRRRRSGAGWSAPITPCLMAADLPSQPGSGAMGFHWGNLAFIQDGGVVNLLQPELLLYEPEKNGKLRFVGVEYIVPFTDHPAARPRRPCWVSEFAQVPEFGVWGLHI